MAELLADENNSLWAAVLYGIRYSEDPIVTVALSQVGIVPYPVQICLLNRRSAVR